MILAAAMEGVDLQDQEGLLYLGGEQEDYLSKQEEKQDYFHQKVLAQDFL